MKLFSVNGLRIMAAALTILTLGRQSQADAAESGIYVAAIGGLNMMSNQDFLFKPSGTANRISQARLGSSWLAGATLGYRLNENLRFEAEYVYRRNKVSGVAVPQFGGGSAIGDFNSVYILANGVVDLANWSIGGAKARPFIGAGLGLAQEIDVDLNSPGRTSLEFSGDKFAYQLLTGVRFEFDSGLFSSVGLSYGKTNDVELKSSLVTGGAVNADYEPLSIRISAGYRF